MDLTQRLFLLLALLPMFATTLSSAEVAPDSATISRQRLQFQAAYQAAQRAPGDAWRKLAIGLESYPLYPYLELADLQQRSELDRGTVDAYLKTWATSLPAHLLRDAYLMQLAKRGLWQDFLDHYETSKNRELRCDELQARIALGKTPSYSDEIEPLWLSATATPAACDAVFAWARAQGNLQTKQLWQRLDLAAAANNAELTGNLAAQLPVSERDDGERIAASLRDPAANLGQAETWPDTSRTRDAIAYGLSRLAKKNSEAAETLWAKLGDKFKFESSQRGRILHALALYRASSFAPDALARLDALPAEFGDDATREWRVRLALSAQNWTDALAALDSLSDTQKADPRWRYLRARMLMKLERNSEANALFTAIAREPNYFGFLAADRTQLPYAVCPLQIAANAGAQAHLNSLPGLQRAFEFQSLGRLKEARREWDFALTDLTLEQRRIAAEIANQHGWFDRAVFAFAHGEELRLYDLRFPLALKNEVETNSRDAGIDAAWTYGIIRAESAWMTDAHSGADAYGLMQLLPGTAARLAKAQKKSSYRNAADLYDPATNIALGTRYLSNMSARFDGRTWLATAAYNAGPEPVDRWLAARGTLDADIFVETIPYRETREYVSSVLAFSVIYDWRLNQTALPLSARLALALNPGTTPATEIPARKQMRCPLPEVPVITPAPVDVKTSAK